MADLSELTDYLDRELDIAGIPDYPGAMNGLQIECRGEINKVVAAVDASLPVFRKAVADGADLLLVHHGMFWQGAQAVTGAVFQKIKLALDHGMALYSCHIPLDVHPSLGNNAGLAREIGMTGAEPFFDWKGIRLGLRQTMDIGLDELVARVEAATGSSAHVCHGGNENCGKVGIITGGAGSEVAAVAACGIDTFITGEGPHWSHPLAEELGVNLIYAGHYATETFGVKALASHIGREFSLDTSFVHHPTGL